MCCCMVWCLRVFVFVCVVVFNCVACLNCCVVIDRVLCCFGLSLRLCVVCDILCDVVCDVLCVCVWFV